MLTGRSVCTTIAYILSFINYYYYYFTEATNSSRLRVLGGMDGSAKY